MFCVFPVFNTSSFNMRIQPYSPPFSNHRKGGGSGGYIPRRRLAHLMPTAIIPFTQKHRPLSPMAAFCCRLATYALSCFIMPLSRTLMCQRNKFLVEIFKNRPLYDRSYVRTTYAKHLFSEASAFAILGSRAVVAFPEQKWINSAP